MGRRPAKCYRYNKNKPYPKTRCVAYEVPKSRPLLRARNVRKTCKRKLIGMSGMLANFYKHVWNLYHILSNKLTTWDSHDHSTSDTVVWKIKNIITKHQHTTNKQKNTCQTNSPSSSLHRRRQRPPRQSRTEATAEVCQTPRSAAWALGVGRGSAGRVAGSGLFGGMSFGFGLFCVFSRLDDFFGFKAIFIYFWQFVVGASQCLLFGVF